MTTRNPLAVAALLTLAAVSAGVGGCDRTYLTPTHGRAYRQVFAVQTVNPNRRVEANAVHGLDSQEASIISANYRRALAPKSDPTAGGAAPQLLMYSPGGGAQGGAMPAPSVPADH
jgi:hypothetical protein